MKKAFLAPSAALVLAFAFLPVILRADCTDAPESTAEHKRALFALVDGGASESEFQVLSETVSDDGKLFFLVYEIAAKSDGAPGQPAGVYLAAVTSDLERLKFIHEVSGYLPAFMAPELNRASDHPGAPAGAQPISMDACLNTFIMPGGSTSLHLNIFGKSELAKKEGANDVIFALKQGAFLDPLLEMNDTSRHNLDPRKPLLQDSVIAVLPQAPDSLEVIWEQFSQLPDAMLSGAYTQVTLYRWKDKGFQNAGTLSPEELAGRMKTATTFSRSRAIVPLRLEYKMPGPNQPSP
jgi:hypothetical protein